MKAQSNPQERVLIDFLRWAPQGALSKAMGLAARTPLPRPLRPAVYRAFANAYGADVGEVERPLDEYASLAEFFTRRLRPGARMFTADNDTLVSPCDGTLSQHGPLEAGHELVQAKGVHYSTAALLGDEESARPFQDGTFMTIYLAPRHYHRVHFPLAGQVTGFRHVPGKFWPVNAAAVAQVPGLFAQNERLVTFLSTAVGEVAIVMVAATGVGNMSVSYDAVQTNSAGKGRAADGRVALHAPVRVEQGDELGVFHQGSTVIMLFGRGAVELAPGHVGEELQCGAPLGHLGESPGAGR